MQNDRDRLVGLLREFRREASELLMLRMDDVDWGRQRIWVISKGTRDRQAIPASPESFTYLGRYLAEAGLPPRGQPIWRTLRGEQRPLTYWAMRQVIERANRHLGTNWTLHDLRHTAAGGWLAIQTSPCLRFRRSCDTCIYPPPSAIPHLALMTWSASWPTITRARPLNRTGPRYTTRMTCGRCSVNSSTRTTARVKRRPPPDRSDLLRTHFEPRQLVPAAPPLPDKPPGPFGDLSRSGTELVVDAVGQAWRRLSPNQVHDRRRGARFVLEYLSHYAGQTWQERWEASGLNDPGRPIGDLAEASGLSGRTLQRGLRRCSVSGWCDRAWRPSTRLDSSATA